MIVGQSTLAVSLSASLTPSGGISTLPSNTLREPGVNTRRGDASPTAAADLGLPGRVRRRARLSAHRARDRRNVGLASPSTVHAHLANLERAGLLRRDPTKPRALELIGRRREPHDVCRRSRSRRQGRRSSARSRPAGRCSPSRTSRATCRCRAGRRATSSSASRASHDRGRHPRRRPRHRPARPGRPQRRDRRRTRRRRRGADEATVKTFYREADRVRLQPENSALEPIYAHHVQILGRVVGVLPEL